MANELLTQAQLRTIESDAEARFGPGVLMARAGEAAARWIASRWPEKTTSVLIVCGPGNNGGDGYACALSLAQRGYAPELVAIAPAAARDAAAMRATWMQRHRVLDRLPDAARHDVVVDALFGIGLSRPLAGVFAAAADWINRQRAHVVSLDCPSGLDTGRGTWVGDTVGVCAQTTISFIAGKPGLYTGAGVDACGDVVIDGLGLEDAVVANGSSLRLNSPSEFSTVLAPRPRDTHKGSFGKLAVVGGNTGMVGAVLLAARAALRLGAGRVLVDAIGAPELHVDLLQPELMLRKVTDLDQVDAAVIGCGLGRDDRARAAMNGCLALGVPAVIDADALALLPESIPTRAVLTPHPLEAARLLSEAVSQVQADRIGAALRLSARTRSLVVLKGAGSVIADGERAWINTTGGPALATAGTGDVLAGMIGALIAQGYSPRAATLAAVWLHGAAADTFGADIGLVAGDVAPLAAQELSRLRHTRGAILD